MKSIHIYLVLSVLIFSQCSKTGTVAKVEEKPEWRITEVITYTENIKLQRCYDTSYIYYDSYGRFAKFSNRLHGVNYNPYPYPTYTFYDAVNANIEYTGNSENIKKVTYTKLDGTPGSNVREYFYDGSGSKIIRHTLSRDGALRMSFDLTYNGDKPSKYIHVEDGGVRWDSAEVELSYQNGLLSRKTIHRLNTYTKTFDYRYNAAGNPVYNLVLSENIQVPDTMRQVFMTWKPSITPNTEKVKRFPKEFHQLIFEFGPYFYFATDNQLTEFDFWNISANGELLDSYYFNWNRYTLMVNKMNFQYQLDSNQNIGKIIGLVPGSASTMEMKIKYEKIN